MAENQAKKPRREEDPAVTRFRDYLRVRTVQPDPDYDSAVTFLQQQANEIGLQYQCVEVAPNRPVIIMTWTGTSPSLPSVMLNSHIDVVPVYPEHWSHDPFSAHKTEDGDIYARGSQDMKCVGMQYLEAIRQLIAAGVSLTRTIHVTFVPDEEIGGKLGMKLFIERQEFKDLNVGFSLDEGLANPTDAFTVFYGERTVKWFKVTCTGNPGHGSRFIDDTAASGIVKLLNNFMEYRNSEETRLKEDPSLRLGDVTTINMTMLAGGVQPNVVPSTLSATFDMRVAPTANERVITDMINEWVCQCNGSLEWLQNNAIVPPTSTDPDDPWFKAFSDACQQLGMKIELEIFPAGTDGRYLREIGLPVLGFSPMNHTPILLHDHDEYLNEDIYLKGIDLYQKILTNLCSVPQL